MRVDGPLARGLGGEGSCPVMVEAPVNHRENLTIAEEPGWRGRPL